MGTDLGTVKGWATDSEREKDLGMGWAMGWGKAMVMETETETAMEKDWVMGWATAYQTVPEGPHFRIIPCPGPLSH